MTIFVHGFSIDGCSFYSAHIWRESSISIGWKHSVSSEAFVKSENIFEKYLFYLIVNKKFWVTILYKYHDKNKCRRGQQGPEFVAEDCKKKNGGVSQTVLTLGILHVYLYVSIYSFSVLIFSNRLPGSKKKIYF